MIFGDGSLEWKQKSVWLIYVVRFVFDTCSGVNYKFSDFAGKWRY